MIRQPTILVIGYVVGVVVACAALASLTKVSLDMEASDLESRQEAALEENVRLALWRIDSDMAALIGRESSWPYYAYSSAYSVGGTTVDAATPPQARITSPLADFNGTWVVARFQIAPDGTVTSPQAGKRVMLDDGTRTVESLLEDLQDPNVRATISAALPDPDVPTLEAVSRVTRTLKSRGSTPAPTTTASAKSDPTLQFRRNATEFDTRLRFYSGSTVPLARFEATRNLIQGFVSGWSDRFAPWKAAGLWSPPAAQLELRSTPILSSLSSNAADTTGGSYGTPAGDYLGSRVMGGGANESTQSGAPSSEQAENWALRQGSVSTLNVGNTYGSSGGNSLMLNGGTLSVQNGTILNGNSTLSTNGEAQSVQTYLASPMSEYNANRYTINSNSQNQQSLLLNNGSQALNFNGNTVPSQIVLNSNAEAPGQQSLVAGQLNYVAAPQAYSNRGGFANEGQISAAGPVEEVRAAWNSGNLSQQSTSVGPQAYGGPTAIVNAPLGNATQQGSALVANGNFAAQNVDNAYGAFNNGLAPQLRSSQLEVNPQGQRLFGDNNLALQTEVVKVSSVTGVMAPVWCGGALWLARKVDIDGMPYLQGCRLDWRGLQRYLQGLTADLLPEVRFEAIVGETTVDAGRLLASIPARIVPGLPAGEAIKARTSSMRTTLAWAWGGLLTAAAAVGLTLWKVTALSERRASFVSSVTHELRTPLTTFRLYGEMLASNMVTEPKQRQEYLETMCAESERLSHLVENVLAYSRLERGHLRGNVAEFTPAEVIARGEARLRRRAEQAGMTFDVVIAEAAQNARLSTDPSAVEQILFNLVDNAGKYAVGQATREVELFADADARNVLIGVRDNGPGIGRVERKRLFRPFSKGAREAAESAPGVGLGLALCRRLARELGGDLKYQPGDVGATFVLALPRSDDKR